MEQAQRKKQQTKKDSFHFASVEAEGVQVVAAGFGLGEIERVDTYLHIRDHVIWDFFIPEVFCDKAITVAFGHPTSPTWHVPETVKDAMLWLFSVTCQLA